MPMTVKPFPFNRIERVSQAAIDLAAASGLDRWREPIEATVSSLARKLGLGAGEVQLARVQAVRLEELRSVFPGNWTFAVFGQPTTGRRGFLGLDPLLATRYLARLEPRREVLPGWSHPPRGDQGAIAWLLCAGLLELSELDPAWEGWRYLGWYESTGQVGRSAGQEELLVGSWLSITAGWDPGFAVWLEPESSVVRRPGRLGTIPDWARLAKVPLGLRWLIGECTLRLGELQVLEAGDLVLIDPPAQPAQITARLGEWRLLAVRTRDGCGLRVERIERVEGGGQMAAEGNHLPVDATEEQLAELLDLPVTLTAEAGRCDLTVARLAGLRAGDVITLPQALLGPVELRTGDRLVARGELVDVEGRRGVRILETGWRPGANHEAIA
jgi:flagellar motor switch/type III secretory pathway protein FliN